MPTNVAACSVALLLVAGACSHDWDAYDPRGGPGPTGSSSSAGAGGSGGGVTCEPGSTAPCYDADIETAGIGVCKKGTNTCAPDGQSYTSCVAQVLPSSETCKGDLADEDCDGVANDHCAIFTNVFFAPYEQRPLALATDAAGNVVVAGRFTGTPDFGGGKLTNAGGYDIFVAKYDSTGKHVWSKRFGGAGDEQATGVAIDGMGTVTVIGDYTGTTTLGAVSHISAGLHDVLVFEIDAAGNYLWSKSFGGPGEQLGLTVAAHSGGDIVIGGRFDSTIDLTDPPYTATDIDGFIARLGPAGEVQWSKAFGASSNDAATAVVMDAMGNAFVTGFFDDSANFGGETLVDFGTDAEDEVFIVKLDPMGNEIWARAYASLHKQRPTGIGIDAAGNAVVSGFFNNGPADFGGGPLADAGLDTVFVLKVDTTGKYVWAKAYGDATKQEQNGMAVDAMGNIILVGATTGDIKFGEYPLTGMNEGDAQDVYVAKLSPAGDHIWSRRFGDADDQDARAAAVTPSGDIYVTGEFAGKIDFGEGDVGPASGDDMFLIKLAP
ncbi:hypothetical protein [Polyangium aurulentum]|uniref:hypothetical protein n=1 Tax=Polyangium aurulentum TaxID=2567896 RepID=UPI0010AE7232|nr:hypothetical protein [Polyangium aurulentum]UQA62991.1 hypothetical protein E8A73_022045 [Polyangium aurulentum]